MSLATLSDLKTKSERRYKNVTLQGLEFRLQNLTAKEYMEYTRVSRPQKKGLDLGQLFLIAACWVNEEGQRVVKFNEVPDLLEMDGGITGWLYLECLDQCGLNAAASDAEKNSETTETSASP